MSIIRHTNRVPGLTCVRIARILYAWPELTQIGPSVVSKPLTTDLTRRLGDDTTAWGRSPYPVFQNGEERQESPADRRNGMTRSGKLVVGCGCGPTRFLETETTASNLPKKALLAPPRRGAVSMSLKVLTGRLPSIDSYVYRRTSAEAINPDHEVTVMQTTCRHLRPM